MKLTTHKFYGSAPLFQAHQELFYLGHFTNNLYNQAFTELGTALNSIKEVGIAPDMELEL